MINQYLLFAGNHPIGGMNDFVQSYDTITKCTQFVKDFNSNLLSELLQDYKDDVDLISSIINTSGYIWFHIVDRNTMSIIMEGKYSTYHYDWNIIYPNSSNNI